jgi:FG-GAP-like repeat/Clostridium epsilon toxin ETX/Bacillus mosquitocidal toxin MTX2
MNKQQLVRDAWTQAGIDTAPGIVSMDFGPGPVANEDWSHGPAYGSRGTFFADVTGDGKADLIIVNDDTIRVRRNTGSDFGPGSVANEDWSHGPAYGSRGTFFADVTGDGKADLIIVNDDTITVRRAVEEPTRPPIGRMTQLEENQSMSLGDYLESPNQTCWASLSTGVDYLYVYRGQNPDTSAGALWSLPIPVGGSHAGTSGPPYRSIQLVMQGDGNLVVYPSPGATALWASNSVRSDAEHSYTARLLDSGEIALRNDPISGIPYWNSPPDPLTDFEISSIEYHLDQSQILTSTPDVEWTEELVNDSGQTQSTTYVHTAQITNTSGWSDTLTIHVGVQTQVHVGIPVFIGGNVTMSVDVTNAYTWNGSVSYVTTDTITQPVNEAPHSHYQVRVMYTHTTISVPYVLHGNYVYKSGKKAQGKVNGVYTGVNGHDLQVQISDKTPVISGTESPGNVV